MSEVLCIVSRDRIFIVIKPIFRECVLSECNERSWEEEEVWEASGDSGATAR